MKNCLVLLTKKYPFDRGEEFIENEIPVLAEAFEKVILIAVAVSDPSVRTRKVPENVEVHAVRASKVTNGVPLAAVKYLPPAGVRRHFGAEEDTLLGSNWKKRLFLAYFAAKSDRIARECAQVLKGTDWSRWEGVTFYSYWFYDTALAALQLKQACPLSRKKAVSRAHRYDLYDEQNPSGYLPLRAFLLSGIDRVYPCSQDGTDYLGRKHPQYADKLSTAYLGTTDHGTGPESADGLRLVSCCHISPVKRVELLAKALSLLAGSGLKLSWTHLGGGEGLDNLKTFAAEKLSFMECSFPGEVKNAELLDFYRTRPADCFVNTSSSEGLPVSIMEACSFGLPIVATDVGGTRELVRDGENGFLLREDFEPSELASLLEKIGRMPPEERSALRNRSRSLWLESFCSESNYARFAEEIQP